MLEKEKRGETISLISLSQSQTMSQTMIGNSKHSIDWATRNKIKKSWWDSNYLYFQ